VLIIRADAAFADLGRRAADELIATRTARGQTVWFAGHWGFRRGALSADAIAGVHPSAPAIPCTMFSE